MGIGLLPCQPHVRGYLEWLADGAEGALKDVVIVRRDEELQRQPNLSAEDEGDAGQQLAERGGRIVDVKDLAERPVELALAGRQGDLFGNPNQVLGSAMADS